MRDSRLHWRSRIRWAIFGVSLLGLLSNEAFACTYSAVPTLCQAYTSAEAVFIGKLERVDKLSPFVVEAQFKVKKSYKGEAAVTHKVQFSAGCGPDLSSVGEDYFVFKEKPYRFGIANLTSRVSKYSAAIEYAERISRKKPIFSIGGRIALASDDLKQVRVDISVRNKIYSRPIDPHGFFEFTTKKDATYSVRISFPFNASILMEDLGEYHDIIESDSVSYAVSFKPNECNYRTFQVTKPRRGMSEGATPLLDGLTASAAR